MREEGGFPSSASLPSAVTGGRRSEGEDVRGGGEGRRGRGGEEGEGRRGEGEGWFTN